MTKIDVFSGFLGAGKTTLIKKLIAEAYKGERLVLIENEFGEIGIDGGFLEEAGIQVTEMNSGCICCSLVGDFGRALQKVLEEYAPDRILIEPSGVGKLSDVLRAIGDAKTAGATLNACVTVVDAKKCRMYMKNFGEFFIDQVQNAGCIVLSHTDTAREDKVQEAMALLQAENDKAVFVTTPWGELDGKTILTTMERRDTLEVSLEALEHEHHHHHDEDEHEHHHHHEHGEDCTCGCHDHEHHHEHEHHHDHEHEHHHDHEHHHHEHGEGCTCGCHDHEGHHHHADEVFGSWGTETTRRYTEEEIASVLASFTESSAYGMVLRSKGIVAAKDGGWIHFDYVPGEADIRRGTPSVTGRLCVIGTGLDKEGIAKLFAVEA